LDIDKVPNKPLYELADGLPLVLYDCAYEDLEWQGLNQQLITDLHQLWYEKTIQAHTIYSMMHCLKSVIEGPEINSSKNNHNYVPLLSRKTERK